MFRTTVAVLIATIYFGIVAPLHSQESIVDSYVYLVLIPETENHQAIVQTGFRVQGSKGIITTLHGIADGKEFSALNNKGDVLKGLTIKLVDVKNDIVLLSSQELDSRPTEGFRQGNLDSLQSITNCQVIGHPVGISLYHKNVITGTPVLKHLNELIPMSASADFDKRQSPSPDIDVLNIEGNLVSGNSGSPLIDANNLVYGMIDGGILGGSAGISWAIPLAKIHWQDGKREGSRIRELANPNIPALFSYEYSSGSNEHIKIVSQDAYSKYRSIKDLIGKVEEGDTIVFWSGDYRGDTSMSWILGMPVFICGIGDSSEVLLPRIHINSGTKVTITNVTIDGGIAVWGILQIGHAMLLSNGLQVMGGSVHMDFCIIKLLRELNPLYNRNSQCAIYIDQLNANKGGFATITNCVIEGGDHGGIYVGRSCIVKIRNCRISNIDSDGMINYGIIGIVCDGGSETTIEECDLRKNYATIYGSGKIIANNNLLE